MGSSCRARFPSAPAPTLTADTHAGNQTVIHGDPPVAVGPFPAVEGDALFAFYAVDNTTGDGLQGLNLQVDDGSGFTTLNGSTVGPGVDGEFAVSGVAPAGTIQYQATLINNNTIVDTFQKWGLGRATIV